jgi:flagellin-like protein
MVYEVVRFKSQASTNININPKGGINTKMKLPRSRKALSPVVASIILIAVTVAVSIAVAAWMGALSFNFMGTEQITFTGYEWGSPGTGTVDPNFILKVKNTGSADLSIASVRIDGVAPLTCNATLPYALQKGDEVAINLTRTNDFTRGTQYEFSLVTAKGTTFGPYIKTAP